MLKAGAKSKVWLTALGLETATTQLINEHSSIQPNWPNDRAFLWVLICTVHLTVCPYHVTYAFQSESTLYSCLNLKEVLARGRGEIKSFNDRSQTQTHNNLVLKLTLNHLAKWAK